MKIIELLNKIANGEDVPKKIKFEGLIYTWDKIGYLHYKDDYCRECSFLEGLRVELVLNAEVEIIEDEEEIDIQSIEEIKEVFIENSSCGEDVKFLARKYNLILQAVKQLDKNIKELR